MMNKILNWTIGSFFRSIGRFLAFLVLGCLAYVLLSGSDFSIPKFSDLLGIEKVYAAENVSLNKKVWKYRTCGMPPYENQCAWVDNEVSMGTHITAPNHLMLDGIMLRVGTSNNFTSGKTYVVYIDVQTNPNLGTAPLREVICGGSQTNSWSSNTDYIDTCTIGNVQLLDSGNKTRYSVFVSPNRNVYGFQVQIYFDHNTIYGPWNEFNWFTSTSSSFVSYSVDSTDAINNLNSSLVENNNNNTTNIINNQNENTQNIINNQNELLGNKCSNIFNIQDTNTTSYNLNSVIKNESSLIFQSVGSWSNLNYSSVPVEKNKTYNFSFSYINTTDKSSLVGAYDLNGNIIQEYYFSGTNGNINFTFNSGNNENVQIRFFGSTGDWSSNNNLRFDNIMISSKTSTFCEYGSYSSKQDETNQALNDLNNNINNDDTTGASSQANSFFTNFTTNTHGLTGIITAPLNAINSLSSSSCVALELPLPYVNQNLTLPCMRPIYTQYFGNFMNLYDIITFGIISYWVLVRIFNLVKDFKNPDHDEIEVMDL